MRSKNDCTPTATPARPGSSSRSPRVTGTAKPSCSHTRRGSNGTELRRECHLRRRPPAALLRLARDAGAPCVVFVAMGEHLIHVRLGPVLDAAHHALERD